MKSDCLNYDEEDIMSEKRLALSDSNRKIAGVCGGLAEYLGVDAGIVRLITVVLFLTGTLGLWVYLIAWLLMPHRSY